ncbi:MAG: hypothetical protein KME22_10210 [Hassallia sp. WJT32-NPBG1]|jgi:hypothetical protein|nr:hypothetical protein [Hassallia sp. WJT32-NPBG1]
MNLQSDLDKSAADLAFKIAELSTKLSETLDALTSKDYSALDEEISSNCDLNLGDLKAILKAITDF